MQKKKRELKKRPKKEEREMRKRAFYTLIVLLCLSVVSTYMLVFLKSLKVVYVSDGLLEKLIAASVAQIAANSYLIYKYLFPKNKR